jgi:signal transduction histidine kinase
MTAAVARPAVAGPDSGADPETPYTSLRARIVIAVVVGGLSLFLGLIGSRGVVNGLEGYPLGLRVADVVGGLGGYVLLWWRRRWPLAFAGYIVVISVFSTLSGGLPFVAAFTVAVHRNWPTALFTSTLLAVTTWPALLLYRSDTMRNTEILMLFVVIVIFAVTGWGMFIRARRQLLASLRRRAERAERSREEHAQHARIAERQRIAREMHDVLAHRLSLLSVQAGALEVTPVPAGDAAVTEAAAAIRATTHQALQELRSIVRVLRDDDEDSTAPPQPVAADLPALVAEASATSAIQADWGGVTLAEVPPDTGRTLYRIVQEGLTNARKHAPGSTVEVTVDGAPDRGLDVAVTSWLPVNRPVPGDGSNGTPGAHGTGTGLIGLRERAALAGGHLDAAVTGDRRFRLSGWLPWAGR